MKARILMMLATAAMPAAPAHGWGWQGHQYVGTVAWSLLNPNARRHVAQLLGPGVSLTQATVWADCARDVHQTSTGFRFWFGPKSPNVCKQFTVAEQARMVAFVSRNWTNCTYSHEQSQCHKAFHFAEVNVVDHDDYAPTYFGAEPYDVVQAIKATTAVLKCRTGEQCAAPAPFNLPEKREALLLIAHYVGDVHQPLHVGAVYLDANAQETGGDAGRETIGGNALLLSADSNLHGLWDSVSNPQPSPAAIAQACEIAPLPAPTPEPPEKWASESVAAARTAYSGMTFSPGTEPGQWNVTLADASTYRSDARTEQKKRLIQAGARLASILNSIWPSKKTAIACR